MAISKEQALYNVIKAKLQSQVAWTLYIDSDLQNKTYDDYIRTESKYYAMRDAYIDSGLLDWTDIGSMPTYTIAHEAKEK